MKRLTVLLLALVLALAACGPSSFSGPPRQLQATTLEQGAKDQPLEYFPDYVLAPGDQVEVLYRFDPGRHLEYRIMPEDTLDIRFLEAPELNSEQKVRPDGMISMPYFDDLQVAGMSPQGLKAKLEQMYSSILYSPKLYVLVKEFHTSLGEIKETIRNQNTGQSKIVLVRSDGEASFPIIGSVRTAGLTFKELSEVINTRYQEVSPNINVDLMLNKATGLKVYVIGAVANPGMFAMDQPVNVVQALSMAGGYRTDAQLSDVLVIRRKGKTVTCTPVDVKGTLSGDTGASLAYLTPNDIVFVPRMKIADAAQVMEYISSITMFRGYSLGFSWELHSQNSNNN